MRTSLARAALEVLESRRLLSSGPLDLSFDTDGKVLASTGLGGGFTDVLVQNDGKVVTVGQSGVVGSTRTFAVFRYNLNGSPDTTFGGGDGIADLPWTLINDDRFEIAITNGGAIVVAGALGDGNVGVGRLTSSGAPDTTFNGTGYLTEQIATSGNLSAQLTLDTSNRILVAVDAGRDPFAQGVNVKRYTTAGAADTTFGPGGVRFVNIPDALSVSELAFRNGKIVVAGTDQGNDLFLVRLLSLSGAADNAFGGGDGIATDVILDASGLSLSIQHDDSIYVAGGKYPVGSTSNPNPMLARVTPDGGLDSWYGGGDGLVVDTTLSNSQWQDVVVQSDGRAIVVGGSGAFFMQRYLHTGDVDTSFGTGGRQTTDVAGFEQASEVALGGDGKIVAAGYINDITGGGITRHLNDIAGITGGTFNDTNGNGAQDTGEGVVNGRTLYLDLDFDGLLDPGEPTTASNANGFFGFASVTPGEYHVRQGLPEGWVQTFPAGDASQVVSLDAGMAAHIFFGSQLQLGQLYGTVFNDIDGNGTRDAIDTGKANVRVYIDGNGNSSFDSGETFVITSQHGAHSTANYQFNLPAGTYTVRVELPPGFTQTFPTGGAARTITLAAGGTSRMNDFGITYPFASVEGFAFNDVDGDGVQESGDSGLAGRTIYDDENNDGILTLGSGGKALEPTATTSSTGYYVLRGLTAGQHRIRQVLPTSVSNTKPTANGGAYLVTLAQNQAATGLDFGSTVTGTAGGFLFEDDNGNGAQDSGEFAYDGFGVSIFLDLDNDGAWDTNEPTSYTGGTGKFNFNNLVPGSYTARIVDTTQVRQTFPANNGGIAFSVVGGQHTAVGPFGVQQLFSMIGYAFNDANANAAFDSGESGVFNRAIYVDANDNGVRDTGEQTSVTDASGLYQFRLPKGNHRLRQVLPAGYEQTGRSVVNAPSSTFASTGIVAIPGDLNIQGARFNFGSRALPLTRVYGFVIRDNDGDGVTDSGEPGNTPGDVVYVDGNNNGSFDFGEANMTTGSNGWFFDLPAGSYVFRQQLPSGWVQTMPGGNAPLTATVTSTPQANGIHAGFFGRYQLPPDPQQPYKGNPFAVGPTPVTIQAEDYDLGGQGVAFNDTTATNVPGLYRPNEAVDIKSQASGQYRISDSIAGEWLEYTIDVAQGGNYEMEFRVSHSGPNSKFHAEIDGVNVTGSLTVPDTNSFNTFASVKKTVALTAGRHVLRFAFDANAAVGYAGGFDWVKITAVTNEEPPPPPPPEGTVTIGNTIAAYVRNGSYAGTNYGNDGQLIVKRSGTVGNTRESYLRFDLSTLPTDPAAITGVKLRVWGRQSATGTGVNVAAYSVSNTSWSETGITWNTKPAAGTTAIQTRTVTGTTGAWYEWDVTDLVKQARQNGQSLVTLALKATNTTDPWATFNSDDATGNKPEIVAQTSTPTAPAQAIVVDNDAIALPEGGTASFNVKLAAAPTSDVIVTISKQAGSDPDVSANKSTLTFTPANWNVAQSVTLSAAEDADSTNNQSFFSVASSGLSTVTVLAVEQDNDGPVDEPTIYQSEAATVRDGTYASQNFGTATELVVKRSTNTGYTRETYLRFDFSSAESITTAKLRINARLSDTSVASLVTQIYSVSNTAWTETGLTWNNRPTTGATLRGSFTVTGTSATWYEVDLTSFIQAEFAAGRKVVTLVLRNPDLSGNGLTLIPSDETANGPQLVAG